MGPPKNTYPPLGLRGGRFGGQWDKRGKRDFMVLTPEKIAQSGTLAGSSIGPPISGGSARQKIEKLQFLGVKPPKKGVFDPSERHFSRSLGFQEPPKKGVSGPPERHFSRSFNWDPIWGGIYPPWGGPGTPKKGFPDPSKTAFFGPNKKCH